MYETREDSLTKHVTLGIHDLACAKYIRASAKFVLAPGCEQREQREERSKVQEKEMKERTDKKRKNEYIA